MIHIILLTILGLCIGEGFGALWRYFKYGNWPLGVVLSFEVVGIILMLIFFVKEGIL